MLGSGCEIQFPPFKDKVALASKFGEFFAQKIVTIHGKLDEMPVDVSPDKTTPSLLVVCIDTVLPVITKIFHCRIIYLPTSGNVPVHPMSKKLGLELNFHNFRPVSNLQYVSKLTEKAVFIQTHGQNIIAQKRPCSKS